jgi:hypothetical protein
MHEGRWAEVAGRDDLVGERKELRSRVRGDDDAALSNVGVLGEDREGFLHCTMCQLRSGGVSSTC